MTVYVVAIEHKHGMNTSVFETREDAQASLYEYVKEWWDSDGPQGEEIPTNASQAIERYFHHDYVTESYTLQECIVQMSTAIVRRGQSVPVTCGDAFTKIETMHETLTALPGQNEAMLEEWAGWLARGHQGVK